MGMSDAMRPEPLGLQLLERTVGWPLSPALSMRLMLGMFCPARALEAVELVVEGVEAVAAVERCEVVSGVGRACDLSWVSVESWRSSSLRSSFLTGGGAGRAVKEGGGAAVEAEGKLGVLIGGDW